MTPGHDLCGRFRLRRVQQQRSDRVVWVANDLVTKRMVRVHIGRAGLLAEVPTLQTIQGRGIVPFVGLWRDGTDVVLVFAHRLPQTSLSDSSNVGATRCVRWLEDLAAAMSRLHVAGVALGTIEPSRIWASGDAAWLDPTGPYSGERSVRQDLNDLCLTITSVSNPVVTQRGPRQLLRLLANPDPDRRPATALGLSRLTERALRYPKRRIGPARVVAFAPRRARQLVVVNPDGSGVRIDGPISDWRRWTRGWTLTKAPARRQWHRVALGWSDVLLTALLGVIGAIVLPCVGGPIALFMAWQWRRARCRPGAGDCLPQVEWGSDEAVTRLGLAVEAELPPPKDASSVHDHGSGP